MAIHELAKTADIILIQEHWLFDCKLNKLNEVNSQLIGKGKAVDTGDPILPVQMPRGYGGTAILWKKELDSLVTTLPDGGNRIQCIELKCHKPLLIIAVYMPSRGQTDNFEDYVDCLDQLCEILKKYSSTHQVVIGGDMNEDLVSRANSRRAQELLNFMNTNSLETQSTEATFIHPNGTDSTTIDYIIYRSDMADKISPICRMDAVGGNVSDHYPVCCKLRHALEKAPIKRQQRLDTQCKLKWEKIDKDLYQSLVDRALPNKTSLGATSVGRLDVDVVKLNEILNTAAASAAPRKPRRHRKAKLEVWTPEIQTALKKKKEAFYQWKLNGRSQDSTNILVINKTLSTKELRRMCRVEKARQYNGQKQEILDCRSQDTALFHKLINKQRGKLKNCVTELNVGENTYRTESEILDGWCMHFQALATPAVEDQFDMKYKHQVDQEMAEIIEIVHHDKPMTESADYVTEAEVVKAIKSLNKGKSLDIFGVSAEHFIHGGAELVSVLVVLLNEMLVLGKVPDSMKLGLVSPVFKKKGTNLDARNYRGITVTPAITKILESVLRQRIKPIIAAQQNNLQRGFTENSSPMNCSLILEEFISDRKDTKSQTYVAFLDAKSAFDVVSHSSLMRKLFHWGIQGQNWSLIDSLHRNAKSFVKWGVGRSESFEIRQGVRQGGILSTDLYKIYVNRLLDRLSDSCLGGRIGEINCVAPTCADDVALVCDKPDNLQALINIAVDYSHMERYYLQPTKSVVLPLDYTPRRQSETHPSNYTWTINDTDMPVVKEAMHVGLMRSANTQETTVQENIKKARRTIYSLMASGLHGENGLDPETSLHLIQTYVLPVLLYGLEVSIPSTKSIEMLEVFYRRFLKQILSLPKTVANPAVYILSGTIPIEGQIHKRILTLFGNICRLDNAIEKDVIRRQLSVKSMKSCGWAVQVRVLLLKYNLPEALMLLDDPVSKYKWKAEVNKTVNNHWVEKIRHSASLYSSLKHLNIGLYRYGHRHPIITSVRNVAEIPRIHTKLKIVTGTYILQTNRASFNQNTVTSQCLMCNDGDETLQHFLLDCTALTSIRTPILNDINNACSGVTNINCSMLQLVVDPSVLAAKLRNPLSEMLVQLEFHSRRLCFSLHVERYKRLSIVPRRTRCRNK